MRPPRFRLRMLMVLVAVAGMVLGTGFQVARLMRLRGEYLLKATHYANLESQAVSLATKYRSTVMRGKSPLDKMGEYYSDLKRKYQRAASRPWTPIPPDPPAPHFLID